MTSSKRNTIIIIGIILSVTVLFAIGNSDIYKDISTSIRLYNEVYRQLLTNYVDPIKARDFTERSLVDMMKELDPYTVFLSREEREPLETLTKGEYGGVGLRISIRNDTLTVISPMDGSPASRANIFPGDQIIKVDSLSTVGLDLNKSAQLIRGKIGTSVTLTIKRPGVPGITEYTLKRENINVTDVSYFGMLEDHVGYIRLSEFSKGASNEVRDAIASLLKQDRRMQGLVLDLRGNPGGLLSEALAVSELFINPGDTLLMTRGRTEIANRVFIAEKKPYLPDDIKLVVLINRGSASASEIVSGVMQDLDRGVIIGAPSFGKGLVQTVFRIDREHALKVTTAKYYIPSGRLIQKPDYIKSPELVEENSPEDTLFYSKNGRPLKGGGGIVPDYKIDVDPLNDYTRELWRQNVFYTFAVHYKSVHGEIRTPVVVDDAMIADFRVFLKQDGFVYHQKNEKSLRNLEKEIRQDAAFKNIANPFASVYAVYDSLNSVKFDENLDQIKRGLVSELSTLAGGLSERIKNDIKNDPAIDKAIEVLSDKMEYNTTLGYAR